MTSEEIRHRLRNFASKEKASALRGFFKTGPGQYGEEVSEREGLSRMKMHIERHMSMTR